MLSTPALEFATSLTTAPPESDVGQVDAGDQNMTPAELRVAREWLSLSQEALAHLLEVELRTVRRWESGAGIIPPGVVEEVLHLQRTAGEQVTACVDLLHTGAGRVLVTYPSDREYHRAHPEAEDWPAAWHRRIAARAAAQVPGVRVVYTTAGDGD